MVLNINILSVNVKIRQTKYMKKGCYVFHRQKIFSLVICFNDRMNETERKSPFKRILNKLSFLLSLKDVLEL